MPIYEYQCRRCGHRLEAMQRLSAPPLRRCPACGGGLKKLISAPSFQFKGSGWYATDYAGKKGGEPKGDGAAEAGSEGKSEAKPEAKSEPKERAAAAAGEPSGSAGGGSKGRSGRRASSGS